MSAAEHGGADRVPGPPGRRSGWPGVLAAGALGAAVAVTAQAQEMKAGGWTITLAPYLWAAGVDGHVTVGGVKADVDESFGDILDNFRFGGMLLADAHNDRFGVAVNGFFLRTEGGGHTGRLDADATSDTASVGAAAYYRLVEWTLGATAGGGPVTLAIQPLAGARWDYSRAEVKAKLNVLDRELGRQADRSEGWVDPIVGSLINLRLSDRWAVAIEGDVGGFGVGSDFTWNAQGLVHYRVPLGRVDLLLGAGYRALYWDYKSGGFESDLLTQGPILGAAVRF